MQTANLPIPFGDDVVIVETERKNVSASGLILPETRYADEGLREGTVVAAGPGVQYPDGSRSTMQVSPGDLVLFSRMAGVEIRYEKGSYLVMSERSIAAVLGEAAFQEEDES
jgi:chaperonin GroES